MSKNETKSGAVIECTECTECTEYTESTESTENGARMQSWPESCVWPEPGKNYIFYDDIIPHELDEEAAELVAIKEYYDSLVEEGVLDDEYKIDVNRLTHSQRTDNEADFTPATGLDYWDDEAGAFLYDLWREDMEECLSELKIESDTPDEIERIIGYHFINENLLRQACTRRSFALDHNLDGCCEELEFLGDSVLNSIVTKELFVQFAEITKSCVAAPFGVQYNEGELSRIRSRFVCKEHLAMRCEKLGLDKYILYGAGDAPSDNSKEDVMEAIIGAVAMDSQWDENTLNDVVDTLVSLQLDYVDSYLQKDFFEVLNTWHQKHFGDLPVYEVYETGNNMVGCGANGRWYCNVRFKVPDYSVVCGSHEGRGEVGNGSDGSGSDSRGGGYSYERTYAQEQTRSKARAKAAQNAYDMLVRLGVWKDLRDAGIEPDFENSIGQVQELYQKKYITEKPVYVFEERPGDKWYVSCAADTYKGWGLAGSKTKAKKKAAFMLLYQLYHSAGINKDEWQEEVFGRIMEQ